MVILAVDDEQLALDSVCAAIREAAPKAELYGFQHAKQALEFVEQHSCDVVFLDIQMRELNGMDLAKRIKFLNPQVNIVFTTAYAEYGAEAFSLRASGYVLKPVTADKIRRELEELRHPVQEESRKRLRIQTFGNFEAYLDGVPMHFQYSKTRELLAYLVDRHGALCTNHELMAILWENGTDRSQRSYLQNLKQDLVSALKSGNCLDVLVRQYGKLGIVPDQIDCDYYDLLAGKPKALNAYRGEYMSQYSWSELTLGSLNTASPDWN